MSCANESHTLYMARAIKLAERGVYTTSPNPRVGCILVKNARVIGEGWHKKAGEGHAEVNALAACGAESKGATAYLTLEPCSHYGRTPPCCDALISAGVARVVIAMTDPNPLVAGRGIERLQHAGIEVLTGILEAEARALNPGFIKRMEQGLPLLRCKMAMSLDGRTAMASGESQWITGSAARRDVQRLRARSCAIVTGIDSILLDDSSLTVRAEELDLFDKELPAAQVVAQRQPLRVVVDSRLRIPLSAKILKQAGRTVVITANQHKNLQKVVQQRGVEVVCLPGADGKVDLQKMLHYLADQQCNEVLLETGARLAGSALQAGLIDELYVYMAPKLLGSEARPLFNLPLHNMDQQLAVRIRQIRAVGDDWCIEALPCYTAAGGRPARECQ